MSGHNNQAIVTSTNDANAVSQLITITNTSGTTWTVWGSSTGSMGSFSGSQSAQNILHISLCSVINFTQNGVPCGVAMW